MIEGGLSCAIRFAEKETIPPRGDTVARTGLIQNFDRVGHDLLDVIGGEFFLAEGVVRFHF